MNLRDHVRHIGNPRHDNCKARTRSKTFTDTRKMTVDIQSPERTAMRMISSTSAAREDGLYVYKACRSEALRTRSGCISSTTRNARPCPQHKHMSQLGEQTRLFIPAWQLVVRRCVAPSCPLRRDDTHTPLSSVRIGTPGTVPEYRATGSYNTQSGQTRMDENRNGTHHDTSKSTTRLAPTRFTPRPPARVETR